MIFHHTQSVVGVNLGQKSGGNGFGQKTDFLEPTNSEEIEIVPHITVSPLVQLTPMISHLI